MVKHNSKSKQQQQFKCGGSNIAESKMKKMYINYPSGKLNNYAAPIKLTAIKVVPCIISILGIAKLLQCDSAKGGKERAALFIYNDSLLSSKK
jgi:hypothetical protein